MYITVKTLKRNLGFKGIELNDVLIGFPIFILFIILFALTPLKLLAVALLMIGIFLMLPVKVSKKNRMYKVLFLVIKYLFRTREYIYVKNCEERKKVFSINEFIKKIN